jgi:phenylalanyl-tRNA synthetase beta chain
VKVPLSWLGQYISLPPERELLPRLTEIGHMLDGSATLPGGQRVISLEIRQNRPDCLSIFGIAREVGAAFSAPIREVPLADLPSEIHHSDYDTPDYICFLHVKGARLDHLPREMLAALEQDGQGSVNPLVDLSNYVMIELGQPIHVYAAPSVDIVSAHSRLALRGETLKLLNSETIALDEQDLVIADRTKPLSLAGVMGGDATKIGAPRGDIIVEAGNFRPALVRRTARRHGLMTEASQRSSKLLAPGLVPMALRRFLALLIQHGTAGEVTLWQAGSTPLCKSEPILLDYRDIERISGVRISIERARSILAFLGFKAEVIQDHKIAAVPPWWRTDVEHPADLIEEVLRIDGYSHIPLQRLESLPPRNSDRQGSLDKSGSYDAASFAQAVGEEAPLNTSDSAWEQEEAVRNLLCAWGYDEAILDAFLIDHVGGFAERSDVVRAENPPASDLDILRPSLVPNLLSSARFLPFLLPQRRLFEVGRTFHSLGGQPVERRTATWVLMLGSGPASWHNPPLQPDFYTIKAEAEAMLEALGVHVSTDIPGSIPFPFLPGKSCCLVDQSGAVVGYVGEVDHRAYDVKPVRVSFAAEIYLPSPSLRQTQCSSKPRREADSFDISILVHEDTRAITIQEQIEQMLGQDLVAVRLIDVYGGKQVNDGTCSYTFRIVYDRRRGEPTAVWREVGNVIAQRLHAEIRGGDQ